MKPRIHPTAVVDPHAEVMDDVEIGPYAVVGPFVKLGVGTRVLSHAVLMGKTTIGAGNVIYPHAVIGGEPQVRKDGDLDGKPGALVIGDQNVFREHVTVNVASAAPPTKVGSKNLLMAGCHVAHDVVLGSNCVIANGVQLAGHVIVEDWTTFGGLSAVAQHLRIGESAFVAGGAKCERSVPPFVIVQGDRARVRALNVVGLRRRGLGPDSMARLKEAFKEVFVRKHRIDTTWKTDADPFLAKFATALEHYFGGPSGNAD